MTPALDALLKSIRDLERTAREQHESRDKLPEVGWAELYAELDDRLNAIERKLGIEPIE
jgi:hypothetical protein